MRITPKNGPTLMQPAGARATESLTPRDRAIQKLMESSQPQQPAPVAAAPSEPTTIEGGAPIEAELPLESRQKDMGETPVSSEQPKAEPEAKPEEPLSSQYAVLARKEKALRARDQQLRAREAAIKAQEDAARAPQKPAFDESKYISRDKFAEDPFGTLSEMGLPYEKIAELAMNAPKPEDLAQKQYLKSLEAKIQKLEESLESNQKSFKEQQEQSYAQVKSQMKNEVKLLVSKDPEFEMISSTGSVDDVVGLIEDTFQNGLDDEHPKGTLLSVEEAARIVEDYLTEEAFKLSKLSKIQKRHQPASAPQQSAPAKQAPTNKTLTNSMASSKPMSARDRAIAAFNGTLKN